MSGWLNWLVLVHIFAKSFDESLVLFNIQILADNSSVSLRLDFSRNFIFGLPFGNMAIEIWVPDFCVFLVEIHDLLLILILVDLCVSWKVLGRSVFGWGEFPWEGLFGILLILRIHLVHVLFVWRVEFVVILRRFGWESVFMGVSSVMRLVRDERFDGLGVLWGTLVLIAVSSSKIKPIWLFLRGGEIDQRLIVNFRLNDFNRRISTIMHSSKRSHRSYFLSWLLPLKSHPQIWRLPSKRRRNHVGKRPQILLNLDTWAFTVIFTIEIRLSVGLDSSQIIHDLALALWDVLNFALFELGVAELVKRDIGCWKVVLVLIGGEDWVSRLVRLVLIVDVIWILENWMFEGGLARWVRII